RGVRDRRRNAFATSVRSPCRGRSHVARDSPAHHEVGDPERGRTTHCWWLKLRRHTRGDFMAFTTEQEQFWAGEFGDEYARRNRGEHWIAANQALFSRVLRSAPGVKSIAELGCNIGLNLQALHRINADFDLTGYELNRSAAEQARSLGIAQVVEATILDPLPDTGRYDIAFTKGVLIH